MEIVVEKILKLMEKDDIIAKNLTKQIGISASSITEWSKGKSKPGTEAIIKIARYFNVSTDYLLFDEYDSPDKTPYLTSVDELSTINRCRDMVNGGRTWEEILLALSLSPKAINIAARWESVDESSREVVSAKLTEEERICLKRKGNIPA